MRTLLIAVLVFVAAFGAPFLATAETAQQLAQRAYDMCIANNRTAAECLPGYRAYGGTGTPQTSATGGIQTNTGNTTNQVQTNVGNNGNTGTNVTLVNPLQGGGNLESFLMNILKFVIRIGTIVVILMLVYVGYLFVAARGEPAKITEARSALLWTVVGALILLGAQVIASGILNTVNAISAGT